MVSYNRDQYLRGDEANLNPPLPGYAVVNLHSTYEISWTVEAMAWAVGLRVRF